MGRTQRERAARLWRLSLGVAAAGVLAAVAAALFAGAVLVGGIAASQTTRRPELVWIVTGILVFWIANSALYLHLVVEANSLVGTVPPQEAIDLLRTLFTAGTIALIATVVLAIGGWVLRPGRWSSLHGPSGQS
jgi:hypothetical protein